MKYKLGIYEKALANSFSLKEKLHYTSQAGLDYLEISIDETEQKLSRLNWKRQQRDDLYQSMRDTGISIGSMCLSGHRKFPLGSLDKEIEIESLRIMSRAIDFAEDLGIPIIQLAGYDVYYTEGNQETRKRFIDNLYKATEMASRSGILLGFETMETAFMDTVTKAMQYVHMIQSPYLHVYPDIGNLTNAAEKYKHDLAEDLEQGRGHLIAMHLKETKTGFYREIPFGTGHVQFKEAIAKAWQLGVRRFVIEAWDTGDGNWENEIVSASRQMRDILNEER